jgi:V8-like Glu-specific endopeptidase
MRDWSKLEKYLKRIAETDGITENHLMSMRDRSGAESTGARKLTEDSIEAWSRFRAGHPLTSEQKSRLEAIVLPNGLRPCFDIRNDTFSDLSDPWDAFNAHKVFLGKCIRAIGRLNVPGHPTLQYAGTALIAGEKLLLTNRHVVESMCQAGGASLTFTPGVIPNIDLKQEVGGADPPTPIKVRAAVMVLTDWDAGLLRIESMPDGVQPPRLAASPVASPEGRLAAIIGYPALDSRGATEEILQQIQIFRAIFDKKRLQPGRLMGLRQTESYGSTVTALAHDCSTLGGNSGSVLIDVEAETIAGLHFGGDYLVANYAIPAWEFASHQRLRDEGVLFS